MSLSCISKLLEEGDEAMLKSRKEFYERLAGTVGVGIILVLAAFGGYSYPKVGIPLLILLFVVMTIGGYMRLQKKMTTNGS